MFSFFDKLFHFECPNPGGEFESASEPLKNPE
jgi:hypothetical protein